jgi:hypothetical protein
MMRALPLAMLSLCVLLATPAAAQTYGNSGAPVCKQVFGPFGHIDCSYSSMAQCRSLATAQAAQCIVNPYAAQRAPRSHRRRGY